MATTILPTYNYTTSTCDAIPTSLPMANAYKYDQLNRIAQSNSFTNFDVANNKWMFGGAIANMYKTNYTYDANGNIKNLQRYNAAGVKFDDMTYRYDEQNGNLISNKLYHVNDAIASGIHTADIDDEGVFQNNNNITTANNYTYDAIGNLTKDVSEQIQNIEWTVSGKIKKIIRTGISTKADLEYVYDAMGNRIAKILKPDGSSLENGGTDNPTQWTYTYYVRDAPRNQFKFVLLHKFRIDRPAAFYAGGNIMANYQKSTASSITSFILIERSIYGSSRLGIDKTTIDLTASITPPIILNHNLGLKNYELSNHLGNVTTVISDRKIPRSTLGTTIDFYMPDIVSATDYYPFGMAMQERTSTVTLSGVEAYRFGFGGHEKINEFLGNENTVDMGDRWLDTRLCRTSKIDKIAIKYPFISPYTYALNNPNIFVDTDGKEVDLSNLTAEQLTKYNTVIELLSSSKLFNFYYQQLVESKSVYTVKATGEINGLKGGGYFDPRSNEVGVGEAFNGYVVAQELFHAYQKDGGFYETNKPKPYSTIETEGDIMDLYVMLECGFGFPNYGDWIKDIFNKALESIPSSIEVGSQEYQNMFQKAVDDRINYYKTQDVNAPNYTSPNTGEKPKAIGAVIQGAEKKAKVNVEDNKKIKK